MILGAEVGVGQHMVAMTIKDDRGPFVVTDKFCVLTIVRTLQFVILCLSFTRPRFWRKSGMCFRDLAFVFLNDCI